jgi:hypothetical protein
MTGELTLVTPGYVDALDPDFTMKELLASKALKGWGYRMLWPTVEWKIEDEDRRYVDKHPGVETARLRWCDETGRHVDNHQTFLVQIGEAPPWSPERKMLRLFVMFHDGMVWIGRSARWDHEQGHKGLLGVQADDANLLNNDGEVK